MSSDFKILTTLRITTDKLSSKKVSSLKLPATFPTSVLEETVSTMSWNN